MVDKIAQSMVYAFSPYEKQIRQSELAKAQVGQMQAQQQIQLAPQTMDLQRREIAMREKQLGFQENLYNRMGNNGEMPSGYVLGANMQPQYNPAKAHELDIMRHNDQQHAAADAAIREFEASQPMSQLTLSPYRRTDDLSKLLLGQTDNEDE